MHSIRKFLLANLLLATFVATSITIFGNYFLDQGDINIHLDALLREFGLALEAVISDDLQHRDLITVQSNLNNILLPSRYKHFRELPKDFLSSGGQFEFQIYDLSTQQLLLHSANAPLEPLAKIETGFRTIQLQRNTWRVFSITDKRDNLLMHIAERYDSRSSLGRRIASNDLYIMLSTYPILGLLIWMIIGRGLAPLTKITEELSCRDPKHLAPVERLNIPIEIEPLVDALNKLFLRLQRALDREKRFSADAAHELRTPLAGLKAQTQFALQLTEGKEKNHALSKLLTSVDRCTHIVEQLLILSRLIPDEPNSIENLNDIRLEALAIEIIAMLVPSALAKNIEVELICKNQNISVKGNGVALGILLRNLIDNAIRYSPDSSEIRIFIEEDKKNVILSVEDNGPGIPPDLRHRVFERFFRVLGTNTAGSGLGLAIVQQIVRLHRAKIKLLSPKTGRGLKVSVFFSKHIA